MVDSTQGAEQSAPKREGGWVLAFFWFSAFFLGCVLTNTYKNNQRREMVELLTNSDGDGRVCALVALINGDGRGGYDACMGEPEPSIRVIDPYANKDGITYT